MQEILCLKPFIMSMEVGNKCKIATSYLKIMPRGSKTTLRHGCE